MPDLPGFAVPMAPRCFHRDQPSDPAPCGAPAAWVRNSGNCFPAGYYCDQHRSPGDARIGAEMVIPRVSVIAEITIAGTDFAGPQAKSEALDRIAAAVAAAGGLLNLLDLSSTVARVPRQDAPETAIGRRGVPTARGVRH